MAALSNERFLCPSRPRSLASSPPSFPSWSGSSRRLGLPPLLFCSVGLPQGDARDRDLDEFPGNISANKKMQMHPASRLHPRGSSHSFSAGGSEERVFHGTRRHVRVPIRPQRPPAAAGKASLPPLPPTAPPTAPRHPGAQGNKQHLLFLFLFLRRRPSALPSSSECY